MDKMRLKVDRERRRQLRKAQTELHVIYGKIKRFLTFTGVLLIAIAFLSAPSHAQTVVSGTIAENTTWDMAGSPYIVSGDVAVRGSSTEAAVLTIAPGVEVRFAPGTGLSIGYSTYKGALSARGTAAAPILFTSNAETPASGDWKALCFYDATDDSETVLENCVVEYGGDYYNGSIYCNYASPTIRNSVVRHGSSHGIYLYQSSPVISGSTISRHAQDGIYGDSGSFARITDNVLSSNGGSALKLYPDSVKNTAGNSGTGNGHDVIEIRGGNVVTSGTWSNQGMPYVVSGDVTVRGSSTETAVLAIAPGVEVRFAQGTGLSIGYSTYKGALSARGTAAAPILFTSNAASPSAGDWKAVYFRDATDDDSTVLENCVVEYGGDYYNGSIYCNYASPTIRNSVIRHGSSHGINLYQSSPVIIGNTISSNLQDGLYSDNGSFPRIADNVLSDNGGSGLNLHPDSMKNASGNSGAGNGRHGIEIRGGYIVSSGSWAHQPLPYVVSGDVTVRGSAVAAARLIVEPGAEVRFASGAGLYIGYGSYQGALLAQGTQAEPILFTSDAAAPAPGDWKAIYFRDAADDTLSVMEYCVVEYGGASYNANVYCQDASPTIQFSTIRNSRHSGIYLYGNGSDQSFIGCNNFKDNQYGVYATTNANPAIHQNNFLRNQVNGIYNTGSAEVHAENNWWGDDAGPGHAGDAVQGNVAAAPWLTAEADCVDLPPTNSPPFAPQNPTPADGAVRVPVRAEGVPIAVTLQWVGGDPNPWDSVTYDVYLGETAESLSPVAAGIEAAEYSLPVLSEGATYFWQIIARDDAGLETAGPVWHFTTLGNPPDLQVTGLNLQPSTDIEAGQSVTFTAAVQNSGSGPVVDAFWVDFIVDEESVGKIRIDEVIPAGGTIQVNRNWTALAGEHRLLVSVDSDQQVVEISDDNNALWEDLPLVVDTTPPELIRSDPADGASVQQVDRIMFFLLDRFGGSVDVPAVCASVVVRDGSGGVVDGTVTETAGQFTFSPAAAPIADGVYQLVFTARDTAGNSRDHVLTFTVDGQAPEGFAITGGTVASGVIQVRPAKNSAATATITLSGTREDQTSVWLNGIQRVAAGTGDWSTPLQLPQGENALEVWIQDGAGNRSNALWVDILVDSVAPTITSVVPADGSFLNVSPAALTVGFEEATSEIDLAASLLSVYDAGHAQVPGEWAFSGSQIAFSPQGELSESVYTIELQLADTLGNQSAVLQSQFTVDATPPPAPQIQPVSSPTHAMTQTISGTKEAFAAILLNGQEVVGHTPDTAWQYMATLASGENRLTFLAEDRAGNQSEGVAAEIVFDDIPPSAVDNLTADGRGDGTTVRLAWTGYDEAVHGDIAAYRVYYEASAFTDVTALTVRATLDAGNFTWPAEGLSKGTAFWFAVVAVDQMGNALNSVTPVSAVPIDTIPPEDITQLVVTAFDQHLRFSWTPSADTANDLAGYRVYFNGAEEGIALSADQTSREETSLAPASAYPFRITAIDHDGNESEGVAATGVTLLENPVGLSAAAHSGYVDLAWQAASPEQLVKHYRVYASQTAFVSVEGMSPVFATGATSAKVAGLTNNTPYWFAVTTVNLSGGEKAAVLPVTATPLPDEEGPEITSVRVDDIPLVSGHTLETPATVTVSATDPAGISRVVFTLDGTEVATDFSAPFAWYLNIAPMEDGSHTLTVAAYDTLGNVTTADYTIQIALALPAAPSISQPVTGAVTNQVLVTVSGLAEKETSVHVYVNGAQSGAPVTVDAKGNFSAQATLVEGENRLQAAAENRAGIGPMSPEVMVTLDTSLPQSPLGLSAQARAGGMIRLSWQMPPDAAAAGFNLYRSAQPFTAVVAAEKVNTHLITALLFEDLTPEDGTWYYRIAAVDGAANESAPSNEAAAVSDATPPRAVAIDYASQGNVDPATGAMAPGKVEVTLTVSEELAATPFLSITPEGGVPMVVELTRASETLYTGSFTILDPTPTAAAYAVFSARDLAGNRGTEIEAGAVLAIDTDGPAVTRLLLSPPEPIKNDAASPVAVILTLGLDEPLKAGTLPELAYRLSGEGRTLVPIASVVEIPPQPGDEQRFQATFELPADAGFSAPETLAFTYQGRDLLENISDRILCKNSFQVYQGALPPLSPPAGFAATALEGGRIRLSWQAVEGAAGYRLYRQAPGEGALTAYLRVDGETEFIDDPGTEGLFYYAIASIREENGETAESALSTPAVEFYADATSPEAPFNLSLELTPQGIKAAWEVPDYPEEVTCRLYRADTDPITSVAGLSPIATDIAQLWAMDSNPSLTDHNYVVTAVDAAGNQSAPSNSAYLNVALLPVATLDVVQTDDLPPVVSWSHPGGSIAGCDIYLGPAESGIKLNSELLTASTFTDTGYSEDERSYTVVAVDANAAESLGRRVTLPLLRTGLNADARLQRGVMNRLVFTVENRSAAAAENVRLKVAVGGRVHLSGVFSVAAEGAISIPVTVGGYGDLSDIEPLSTTLEITPNEGETVRIVHTNEIAVVDGALTLQILNEVFTRGGEGRVRFALANTGAAEIEIVTALDGGKTASDEITFYLVDADDNVLSAAAFKQALSGGVVTLANGATVARIAAGETFTSEPVALPVPATAPDDVVVRLEIGSIYFHLGGEDEVAMAGPGTTHGLTLVDTAYTGEVTGITPETSTGDQEIVITGRALSRETGEPTSGVPLNLVITLNGFERSVEVFTAADGSFSHVFIPLEGEGGTYSVRAVHPDLTDRPVQGQFVISKVAVAPAAISLNIPKNYEQTISLEAAAGDGTEVHNLRLVWAEADQPEGIFPAGIHLMPGAAVADLSARETAELSFSIWADNAASEAETLVLTVQSDGETGPTTWGRVVINARFSEAAPYLAVTPHHLETGVARGESVTETLSLENKGTADLNDVTISIVNPDGTQAPDWVKLNSAAGLGTLAVGESREVSLTFAPLETVPADNYTFYLRAQSANAGPVETVLFVAVTESGIGNVLFKVSDIYTGTIDAATQEPVQGLKGARVTVQNEDVTTVEAEKTTDEAGEVLFTELPAGRYKCRITAANHQETISRFVIKPGVTTAKDVFLDYNLVTVEWSVTETTIEDKYDIVLTATYETEVPAAVVVAEPASLTLPDMKAGDVLNGEFTLTNYGLVRADDLKISVPQDDRHFRYEILAGLPESLAAKERITVPYRLTCLAALNPDDDGEATGGGCYSYYKVIQAIYNWICANGVWSGGSTRHAFTYAVGSGCGGSGGSVYFSGTHYGDASTGGGGTCPETYIGQCLPTPPKSPCEGDACCGANNEGEQNKQDEAAPEVNMLSREYATDDVDIAVRVPGGEVSAGRSYRGFSWGWTHDQDNLHFEVEDFDGTLGAIEKDGVRYAATSPGSGVYKNESYLIKKEATGFRWEDKAGKWKTFDDTGRLSAYGNRKGTIAQMVYEPIEGGRLVGYADRNGLQVLSLEYDGQGRLSGIADNNGRRVGYTYDGERLSGVTDVLGNQKLFEYDTEGRISKTTDGAGRSQNITYNTYSYVTSVLDDQGRGNFFDYDYDKLKQEYYAQIKSTAGRLKEVWYDRDGKTRRVDINGRTVQQIQKDGRTLLVTDEKGNTTRKEFDEWDNLVRIVHPDGATETKAYEHTFNKPVQKTDENGIVTRYEYDAAGNTIRKIEAMGTIDERVTEYAYDADNNMTMIRRLGDSRTAEAVTLMAYDALGNMTTLTDPEGNITRFTYDPMGKVLTKEDPRGNLWQYEYDAAGRLIAVTDPLNQVSRIAYDASGNKVKAVDPEGIEERFAYDDHSNLIRRTNGAGNETLFEYNDLGKRTRQIDPEGKALGYTYDLDGRLAQTVDGNGNAVVLEYDGLYASCAGCSGGGETAKPSRITYPTCSREYRYDKRGRKTLEKDVLSAAEEYITRFAYDAAGRLTERTDKEDNTTRYVYDALGRLAMVVDPLDQETRYGYDARDNLIELVDAKGQTTRFEYDRNNRLVKEIRPEGQETRYGYDSAGNLIQKNDAKNQKTTYTYDDAGRLAQIRYFSAADQNTPEKTVSFTYDKAGNLTGYDDGSTSAAYTYDDAYRKIAETVDYGPFALSYGYDYYANGMKKAFTAADGTTYSYTYDANNQLTGVALPGTGFITVNAYKWNRPETITLPGGSTKAFSYDPLMRIEAIQVKDPGQNVLMDYQYAYDKMDNILAKDTEHGAYQYDYDDLYRLTTAIRPAEDEAFTYDAVGNRLTAEGVAGVWSYNQNNELAGYADVSFDYDANGNMVRKTDGDGVIIYLYNIENRMVRVEVFSSKVIAEYYYDPFGRRLWKEVDGVRTYFLYSDEGLIGEYDAAGGEIKAYGWKPGSTWGTDPFFMKIGEAYYFCHNDHLGTPLKITAVNGGVVWEANYTAFGVANIDISSTITNSLRFAGQYFDAETELNYNWNRYYDPKIGRYLRTDPIGIEGGINLYVYVHNKPVELIDPYGLFKFRHHGNWGGPGWAAGREISESQLTQKDFDDIEATDDRDQCYKEHDRCIWKEYKRQGDCVNEDELSDAIEKCDHKLGNCLITIPPWKLCYWFTERGNNSEGEPMGVPLPVPIEATMFHSAIPLFVH